MGYLSVDFGCRKIRLLETEGTAKRIKLKAFRMIDTLREGVEMLDDPPSAKTTAETFKRTLSKNKFSRDPSCMALDTSYCIIRDISLPFKGDDQIRKVIKFESESHIQHDIDDVVVSYFKRSETVDKSNLMVFAAKKSDLRKHLDFLDNVGIDPAQIDVDILCLYNALCGTGVVKDHKCFIVVSAGREKTDLLVINKERLVSCRSIPICAGGIAAALTHDLKEGQLEPSDSGVRLLGFTNDQAVTERVFEGDAALLDDSGAQSDGEAETSTEKEGDQPASTEPAAAKSDAAGTGSAKKGTSPPASSASDSDRAEALASGRRQDYLRKFKREVMRVLTFLQMEHTPEKVYLTGMGSRMPGLKETAESLFHTTAEELDLLGRVDHSFSPSEVRAINNEVGVSLGLAYKQMGSDATRVDFRQENVRYAKKFDQIKIPLVYLTLLVLIMTILLNLELYKKRDVKKRELRYIYAYSLQELSEALGDKQEAERLVSSEKPDSRDGVMLIKDILTRKNTELLDELGRGGTIPELPSVFPVWHAVFSALMERDKDLEIFKLDEFRIDTRVNPPTLQLSGEVGTGEDMSTLINILSEVPMLYDVKPGEDKPTPSGNREFSNIKAFIRFEKEEG